jgi:hypothetical protein
VDVGGFGKNDRAQLFATRSSYVSSKGLVATFVQPSLCRVRDLYPAVARRAVLPRSRL